MTPLSLPENWRQWPPHAKARLLEMLREQAQTGPPWWCDRAGCDGEPHGMWTAPHARHQQRPPDPGWDVWLILAGRGFGKTRSGAEWSWRKARDFPRGALIGPTAADVRDTMVEGESGILATAPPAWRPLYESSKRRLTYPNGAIQTTYSADEPERLRGPQHHYGWVDELASMRRGADMWDNLRLGMRLGQHPEILVTGTPKPIPLLKTLVTDDGVVVTKGSTYDNVGNLAPAFKRVILKAYEGTRLGRQELHAEILDDIEGALFKSAWFQRGTFKAEDCSRILVGVDPAGSHRAGSDQTGIIVAAAVGGGFLILSDRSGQWTPDEWGKVVAHEVDRWGADLVVAESNYGGDMVKAVLRNAKVATRTKMVHASRGKHVRAEPIAALYEQGRVAHVDGLGALETQMTEWVPGASDSPDRVDAMVWAVTELSGRALAPVQVFGT